MEASPGGLQRPNVLLGVSGSVATIKLSQLAAQLQAFANVRVVATAAALNFFKREDLPPGVDLFTDAEEWAVWRKKGDPVLHVELRKWADVLMIAPLSSNTLAKMANGLNDNLLTCVARAWDFKKPLIVAPAMNTFMWEHPLTPQHLNVLKGFGVRQVAPVAKVLACKDVGLGAMAELPDLVAAVRTALASATSATTVSSSS